MLETPEKIRELQRKLYQKAKQEKEYRFYLLYDKVYRMDILSHAYRLVKTNKGAGGVDGVTFEDIEFKGNTEKALSGIKTVLGDLKLSLNEEKTKVVDARKESFNFLGFTIKVKENPTTGKKFPLIIPSKKAMKHIKAEIKNLTCRKNLALPKGVIISKLNEVVRGWVNYFYYGNCSNDLLRLKGYLNERVRTYLRRKYCIKNRGYKAFPYKYLYENLRLYKIPTTAPWTQTAKAYGRR